MSALASRLARDGAAAAFLATMLASPPALAGPEAKAPDLPAAFATAEAGQKAVAIMRESARACLSHQAGMLASISRLKPVGEEGPPEAGSPNRKALDEIFGLRQAQLMLHLNVDPRERAEEALGGLPAPAEAMAAIEGYARLRRACVAWSDRSLVALRDAMRGEPGPELEARLAKAREAAAADDARVRALSEARKGLSERSISEMMTFAPRR